MLRWVCLWGCLSSFDLFQLIETDAAWTIDGLIDLSSDPDQLLMTHLSIVDGLISQWIDQWIAQLIIFLYLFIFDKT